MREILFKGIRKSTGKWVYGDFQLCSEQYLIVERATGNKYKVIPESVSEFTGLTDKNGKKIFEGDIVKVESQLYGSPFWDGKIGKVVYEECSYFVEPENPIESEYLFADECAEFEVIGNIHDTPELLKGGAE